MSLNDFDINLIVTAGAVLLAVMAMIYAFLVASTGGQPGQKWKTKCADLDRQIGLTDSVFGSYPGLIPVSYTHLTLPTKA